MQSELRFENLKRRLMGQRVRFRRLAADSLLIYIDCMPGDNDGMTIWFEPIWHYCGPEGVRIGSMQVAKAALESGEAMAILADAAMAPLLGRAIEDVSVEPRTFDLTVRFEGNYYIKTCVSDALADESWHIRDNSNGLRLTGSPKGIE